MDSMRYEYEPLRTIPQFLGDRAYRRAIAVFCSLLKSVPIHRYLLTFTEYLVHSVLSWNPSLSAYWAWLQNGRLFAPRTPPSWGFRETICPGSLKKVCSEKWGAASTPPLRRRQLNICRSSKQPTRFPAVSFVFFPLFSFINSQRKLHTKSGWRSM